MFQMLRTVTAVCNSAVSVVVRPHPDAVYAKWVIAFSEKLQVGIALNVKLKKIYTSLCEQD